MDQLEREEMRRRGRAKLARTKLRPSRLRLRVFVAAIAVFAVLWAVVFVQMVTGNDPALSPTATAAPSEDPAMIAPPPSAAVMREEEQTEREAEEKETSFFRKVDRIQEGFSKSKHTEREAERFEARMIGLEGTLVREIEELEPVTTRQS